MVHTLKKSRAEQFFVKKHLLEELSTNHVKITFPGKIISFCFCYSHLHFEFYTFSTLPGEIVRIIMNYTVDGKRKLYVGFYSRRKLNKIFKALINTITVGLFNTILFKRMEHV